MKPYLIAISIIAIVLIGCEKEIQVDLNASDPQLIIEGNVTNELKRHTVKITRTVNFSDANSFPEVSNALVWITSDNGIADTLTEVEPGEYQSRIWQGLEGTVYTLNVKVDNKTFLAVSRMPTKVLLDSITFNKIQAPGFGEEVYLPVPVYTDPVIRGNFYRFVLVKNQTEDKTYHLSNDNVSNGITNRTPIRSASISIQKGDSVRLEFRCIDEETYLYFFTLSQIAGGGPGGGTTPTNPPNNIKGDKALGYFSAHTSQQMIQVVQ